MKAASFSYFKPADLPEAMRLLALHGEVGKVIAGGQSLVPSMNFRLARPETLIDINGLAELQGIRDAGDMVEIGALTRHAAFHEPICDGPTGRLLTKVVQHVAHYPIRQRGTFGGSLAHADPASEWCLVTATLDGEVEIMGQGGIRRVAAAGYFRSSFMTAVRPDELLTRVYLPKLPEGWGTGFSEFSRRKGDFALSMALAALRVERGAIAGVYLGIGAVAAHALRLSAIEDRLTGAPATADTVTAAAAEVAALISPSSDIHGSADYRRELSVAMVRRALIEALDEAQG
jgi:carbon-monoxide dehydrogenase medium subunit